MDYQKIKTGTEQKFESLDFKPGDIFSEMLSNWKVIVRVERDNITVIQGPHSNLELKIFTKEEFKNHCRYKHRDGYWIDFMKNNPSRVSDYIEAYIEQMKLTPQDIREFKLDMIL
jgi:hypothetical protein